MCTHRRVARSKAAAAYGLIDSMQNLTVSPAGPPHVNPQPVPPAAAQATRASTSALNEGGHDGIPAAAQATSAASASALDEGGHDGIPAAAQATSAASTSALGGIQHLLAIRFAGLMEELEALATSCATGYADIHRYKRVSDMCETLGIKVNRLQIAVYQDTYVSWEDVHKFLGLKPGFKNAGRLHTLAIKTQEHLRARAPGSLSVDNTLLLQQLNHMLGDKLIGRNSTDPVAVQASRWGRVPLKVRLERVVGRASVE